MGVSTPIRYSRREHGWEARRKAWKRAYALYHRGTGQKADSGIKMEIMLKLGSGRDARHTDARMIIAVRDNARRRRNILAQWPAYRERLRARVQDAVREIWARGSHDWKPMHEALSKIGDERVTDIKARIDSGSGLREPTAPRTLREIARIGGQTMKRTGQLYDAIVKSVFVPRSLSLDIGTGS